MDHTKKDANKKSNSSNANNVSPNAMGLMAPAYNLSSKDSSSIESAFGGADLSGVKAHTSKAADSATNRSGANAYTTGSNVSLGSDSGSGHQAAHEAAHVVQQDKGKKK